MLVECSESHLLYAGLSKARNPRKLGSFLIRWVESERFWGLFHSSHVFAVFPGYPGRRFYMVHEAAGAMVRFVSEPNFKSHSVITHLYKFTFTREEFVRIRRSSEFLAGTPYAAMENLGILIVRLVRLFGIAIKNPFGSGSRAQKCSELIMRMVIREFMETRLGPDFSAKQFYSCILRDRGHCLPKDIDTYGVRDLFEVMEWLSDLGFISREPLSNPMRVSCSSRELESLK